MEAAVPTPVPPVDGCADPVPFGPSSSPPHQVHIPGTSPPHLHPRTEQPPEAPPSHPLPSGGCAQAAVRAKPSAAPAPYLPMVRFPTMWPDFTSMTADTLLVWGERAQLRQCSPHLTPNQTRGNGSDQPKGSETAAHPGACLHAVLNLALLSSGIFLLGTPQLYQDWAGFGQHLAPPLAGAQQRWLGIAEGSRRTVHSENSHLCPAGKQGRAHRHTASAGAVATPGAAQPGPQSPPQAVPKLTRLRRKRGARLELGRMA